MSPTQAGSRPRSPAGRSRTSVAVVGAGIVGLSCAWRLAEHGHDVTMFDPAPGQGASWAAAGMLAPGGEAWFGEEALLALGTSSLRRWPRFAADLGRTSGQDPELRRAGTLLAAATGDDASDVERSVALMRRHGIAVEPVGRRELRRREGALHPALHGAYAVPGDHSVDNRRLTAALREAVRARGVELVADHADVVTTDGTAEGVRTRSDGRTHRADVVVAAGGARLRETTGVPPALADAVRPVKGQILRVRGGAGLLKHTVRALVRGTGVYLVPRDDGEIVVGATTEEVGYDEDVTVEAVHDLLRVAVQVVPELRGCRFTDAVARLRPGTPDNLPLVGPADVHGLLVATGHYRSGVLLAPLTADAIVAHVEGRPDPMPEADPRRIARRTAASPTPSPATRGER
ncbi:glycine oxidase ThiO [Mumia flava]|uniref:glycine oxidase ThiO n=1 Tax=Mumia flava TaxID=1348852 RepID=UPI0012FE6B17|nr:glycine oxidase ThiO [Mumia flava]